MINFASNLNKMINAGLGGPLDPPRTEVAVGHRVIYTEVSGDVVNFETNVIAPVKNLRVTMEPIQEGTGDPSPENIRPITGRDAVTVYRSGADMSDPQSVTVQLGQTVYDGILDLSTGTLTIDKVLQTFAGSTLYKDNGTYKIWMKGGMPKSVATYANSSLSNITNFFGNVASTRLETKIQLAYGTQNNFFASIPADFNIADVQVCYELETPLSIQLTPAQLSTLAGENNIWSDAGNISLEFPYYEETEGY